MKPKYRLAILDEYSPCEYGIEERTKHGKWLLLCGPNMTLKEAIAEVKSLEKANQKGN